MGKLHVYACNNLKILVKYTRGVSDKEIMIAKSTAKCPKTYKMEEHI